MNPIQLQQQLLNNNKDLQEYFNDIKKWGEDMKRKDESLKNCTQKEMETPASINKIDKVKKIKNDTIKPKLTKKIQKDYKFWDNFDAEAECEKLDKEKSDSDSDLTDEMDESAIELAMQEKDKGNKFVKSGRFKDAIKCYTNAIQSYAYDPVFYANRALCHLKLHEYKSAESDCTTALQIDKTYIKALHRRATAREALKQYKEAKLDLENVLQIEPNNKESMNLLETIKSKMKEEPVVETSVQRPVSKFTLSRRKQKDTKTKDLVAADKTPVEAIKDKVIERKRPEELKPIAGVDINLTTSEAKRIETVHWPAGEEVELIIPINKPPKERSQSRLKNIKIQNANVIYPNKTEEVLHKIEKSVVAKETVINISNQNNKKQIMNPFDSLIYDVDISGEDLRELDCSVPTTSVQFYKQWKSLKNMKQKYLYLRQINPPLLSSIFKNYLESKYFTEILEVLAEVFIDKKVNVFEYLYGLTKVKRFSALVMFKNDKDKTALYKLFEFIKTDNRRTKDEIDYLLKKYEL